ncbi:LEA type 2 family protein [Flagellimonas marina]|uniref:LEA type 2 family protein n=1 Tax=Flagellimonas marina TaxID=1775168 RepID=A0ABV8PMD9_9FLAO
MKKIALVLGTFLFFMSCSKKPEFVAIDHVTIKGLTENALVVGMDYVVYNPNNVKTKLRQSSMEIFYKDSLVGKGFLNEQMSLAANDTIRIPVTCEIELKSLNSFYPELLASDSTEFALKGNGKVSFLLNSFTIALDDKIHLNTKKAILEEISKNLDYGNNFKIRSISSNRLPSLSKTHLKLGVETLNRLPIAYTINTMKLEFYLDENKGHVAAWTMDEPFFQEALQSTTIPIDVTLSNFDILKQMKFSWLTNQKANFTILGEAQIKIQEYEFNVPIQDYVEIGL